ncbi:hypothetical protein MA16_Dca007769 [Dendrobium catenatum]|uniref:Uncharacterized protein n=1 Tax=Dendrobium catenatum TaxID=906689 RepID=A0A2I0X5E1_9ASPA|nr:hypothetical protein MA16_Dca007769 [Dendrobium catenatum]
MNSRKCTALATSSWGLDAKLMCLEVVKKHTEFTLFKEKKIHCEMVNSAKWRKKFFFILSIEGCLLAAFLQAPLQFQHKMPAINSPERTRPRRSNNQVAHYTIPLSRSPYPAQHTTSVETEESPFSERVACYLEKDAKRCWRVASQGQDERRGAGSSFQGMDGRRLSSETP